MVKKCDNTSSGIIFEENGKILLIERHNYPQAVALPAGHLDGDKPNGNAILESSQEVGLALTDMNLFWHNTVDNPCKREGGNHHDWWIFKARKWSGEVKAGDDAKKAFWSSYEELQKFAARTEYFMRKYNIPYTEVGRLTKEIFGDVPAEKKTDPEWQAEMGLEPVWYFILKALKLI